MKRYEELYDRIPLFEGIEKENLKRMLKCLEIHIMEFGRGEMIFHEGDPAVYIGVVLTGSVQIVRDDYYGNRSIIATIPALQLFAEAFPCAKISALPIGVCADTDTTVMLIDCKKILQPCCNVCEFHHTLIYNLLQNVSRKNLLLNQKIEITSKKTTKDKLMTFLLVQAKQKGSNAFTIDYDRQTLADYLGGERSAMSAEIGKLQEEGYIEVNRRFFRILREWE